MHKIYSLGGIEADSRNGYNYKYYTMSAFTLGAVNPYIPPNPRRLWLFVQSSPTSSTNYCRLRFNSEGLSFELMPGDSMFINQENPYIGAIDVYQPASGGGYLRAIECEVRVL
jgi:hypothetical protein